MKKSITKMLAVGLCAAMVVLTGCGASETTGNTNAAEKTDSAQSEAACLLYTSPSPRDS